MFQHVFLSSFYFTLLPCCPKFYTLPGTCVRNHAFFFERYRRIPSMSAALSLRCGRPDTAAMPMTLPPDCFIGNAPLQHAYSIGSRSQSRTISSPFSVNSQKNRRLLRSSVLTVFRFRRSHCSWNSPVPPGKYQNTTTRLISISTASGPSYS